MGFSIKEAFAFGWASFRARPWFFLEVSLLALAASALSGFLEGFVTSALGRPAGDVLSVAIALGIDTLIGMGVLSVYLKAHDALMSPTLADAWHPHPFFRYLATNLLVLTALVAGYLAFIIPGVILTAALCYSSAIVIDRGSGPLAAMKESARLTRGHRGRLLLFILASIGINAAGALALGIGLFVSVPVTLLASLHVYRTLSGTPAAA